MREKDSPRKREKRILPAALLLILVLAALALFPLFSAAARQTAEETGTDDAVIVPDEQETPVGSAEIPRYDPSMSGDEGWVRADGKLFYLQGGGPVTGLRLIDGKYCYFDDKGVKAAAVGIDVSTYNEEIDWERVREQGIDFVIIRVGGRGWTSGSLYPDLRCAAYLHGAKKAGLRIGVYFYSTAVNEAEAVREADAALAVLRGMELELPVFIDLELSGEYPRGRADGLSSAERSAVAAAFCERIESAGYRAGVYSGKYYFHTALDLNSLSRYTLWVASYTNNRMPPRFRAEYSLWQFTDRGAVDGIRSPVDMNVLFDKIA